MPTEKEIAIVTKAAIFDLIQIFEKDEGRTYTVKEIKTILAAYAKKTDG